MHLQTGGRRVPAPAAGGAPAAGCSRWQIAPLCASPGCPQYWKTESGGQNGIRCKGDKKQGQGEEEEGRV